MSERLLRNVFVFGTLLFLVILGVMTVDSLSQVTSARTAEVTDEVVAGKRLWQAKNCNDCHTILGIGGYYAPDLTKVADRRGADWLRRWFEEPQALIPATTMPNQNLTAADVPNMVAFLQWVAKIDTNSWPPKPMMAVGESGESLSGGLLFQQEGCAGCHRINGQGAAGPGPDLTRLGSQPYDGLPNTAEGLAKWLADPSAVKAGTSMPRIPLNAAEIDALVKYLTSLR